jgi:hypothetical protein
VNYIITHFVPVESLYRNVSARSRSHMKPPYAKTPYDLKKLQCYCTRQVNLLRFSAYGGEYGGQSSTRLFANSKSTQRMLSLMLRGISGLLSEYCLPFIQYAFKYWPTTNLCWPRICRELSTGQVGWLKSSPPTIRMYYPKFSGTLSLPTLSTSDTILERDVRK